MRFSKRFHFLFLFVVAVKAFDGAVQCFAGILLLGIKATTLEHILSIITQRELSEDPGDIAAQWILSAVHHLQLSTQLFIAFFLLGHGVLKLFLAWNLHREVSWAFPISLGVLGFFIASQSMRLITVHFSWPLLLFTVMDAVVFAGVLMEYLALRSTERSR
jgi:uncharacterized membrane protein